MADTETTVNVWPCEACDEIFATKDEVLKHWRETHSAKARRAQDRETVDTDDETPPQPRSRGRSPKGRPPRKPRPKAPEMSPVRTGLTLTYALCGQAFGMFGPEPKEARNAVSMSIAMTAGQGGYALDRLASRTPLYKALNGFFGAAGVLEDCTPLGIPLIVGMYAYAPDAAKERLRPMAGSVLGLLMLQTFGPEPPAAPGDMTPVALPPWIQEFVNGLLGEPPVRNMHPEAPPTAA